MSNSIVYIHEGFNNPGDCFSYAGARHYIHQILPVVYEQSVALRSTHDIPSRLDLSGPDLVVFTGAPWFWENCTNSVKYAGAYAHLQMMRDVRKIAVGIGSCFLAVHSKSRIESIIRSESKALKDFWSCFDTIIVRDILTWWVLSLLGIEAILAPCPSVAVGEWYGAFPGAGNTIVLSEPLEMNFIYTYLTEDDERFYLMETDRLVKAGASTMAWIIRDRSTLPHISLKSMCQEIVQAKASRFFTARVHAALVAMGLGLQGNLLALDSRALSAKLYGADLVGSKASAFETLSANLEPIAPAAVDIRDAINCSLEALL